MATARSSLRVFVSYASEDAVYLEELEKHLSPLVVMSDLRIWDDRKIRAGEVRETVRREEIESADVIVVLLSADYLASEEANKDVKRALERHAEGRTRVIPIIVRSCFWQSSLLGRLQALPADGKAISAHRYQDEAWAEIAVAIADIVRYRPDSTPPPATTVKPTKIRPIGEIFRTSDISEVTYVEPDQFKRLRLYLQNMGEGLVIEGPSGVGKSTIAKRALRDLGVAGERWLLGQREDDRKKLDVLLASGFKGHLVIDDFHRLDGPRQARVADAMKIIADEGTRDTKLTVIGINPVGDSLIAALSDLTGRFRTIRVGKQPTEKIAQLVRKGEEAANIVFKYRDELIRESAGSFFMAQTLCFEAATQGEIDKTAPVLTFVDVGFLAVKDVVVEDLKQRYFALLRWVACHDERVPPRGAGLALLWLLASSEQGHASLDDVHFRFADPHVRQGLAWLKSSQLAGGFDAKPELRSLFYYNKASGVLSIEDPRLTFYLRHMSWPAFITDTNHKNARIDQDGTLVFSKRGPSDRPVASESFVNVLHLSDLHFTNAAQADVWYGQLAEDLKDMECERVDTLVLSGDLTQKADNAELDAMQKFLLLLSTEYRISPAQVLLVPGNHDLSWPASKAAYSLRRRADYPDPLTEGQFIAHGSEVVEVRDEALYKKRFEPFSKYYRQIKGVPYPLDYAAQFELLDLPKENLIFLGLNSAWETDHQFKSRASIHMGALSQALTDLRKSSSHAKRLKIAVWHHPLNGSGEDRIQDHGFLQQLAKAGFSLVLHGHVHKADRGLFRYDMSPDGRRLEIVSAGTFGAPTREWVPGYPLQYNLLRISKERIVVETRCRAEPNGAWQPDARWLQGSGKNPLPYYEIPLVTAGSSAP